MAAKTTSGSGFDPKFGLLVPSFLLESAFVAVYRQVLSNFDLRAVRCQISAVPLYEMRYWRFDISKTKRVRKAKLSTFVDCITQSITPQKFWAQRLSWGQGSAPSMGWNAKMTTSSHLTKVWCPWAMTLKFFTNIVAVYRQVLSDFTLRAVSHARCRQRHCTRCDIGDFISQKLNEPEKRNFPRL